MNVTMRYRLSDAGQRAALLAGRPATAQVVETMETTPTAELLAACQITPAGSAELVAETYRYETLHLDAPPESVEHLARLWEAHQAAVVAGEEARAADAKRQKEEREAAHLAAIEAAREKVNAAIESGVFECWGSHLKVDGESLPMCAEYQERAKAAVKARADAAAAEKKAKSEAKAAAREEMVRTRGGLVFPVEGGFCDFRGQGLWSNYQEKRWVGLFSGARGIDRFLEGPRGEFTWDVTPLEKGDCIQGGGFSQNSRGKRKNESEFFAVVVERTETEIVISEKPTRAAALKVAR